MPQTAHVAVIGAGIVGAATAHALLDKGVRVTLIDPARAGDAQAASYGNGAFISPASIIPMSMPGLWRNVPRYLLDPMGPLTIRWASLPRLLPWLVRFLAAGATEQRVTKTAATLWALLHDGPARHSALAARHGLSDYIRTDGLLYAYPDRAAFTAESLAWRLRRANGLQWREVEGDALRAFEPALSPHYAFAAVVEEGAHCTDPGAYVAALVAAAEGRGAQFVQARATGFVRGSGLQAVETTVGPVACTHAVIAAGYQSAALARQLGDRIPLVSERGYHVEVPHARGGPTRPVMPSEGKMANTPLTGRLRAAGQVEIAVPTAAPNWKRADILLKNMQIAYPQLRFEPTEVTRWLGHRPSTPDGLPVIGPARGCVQVIHAFGHGHVGLAAAPVTAAQVAALITASPLPLAAQPFSPTRFR
ncbi:D-amino acid dehydrogenase protein (plasmid) [Ketogulonicigenium robustum]|uniref:D-amino acid dehydrogenase protein n=1 Tax=Ketogulonicigenium robustum TaxID=92947 RepID=A0A1W6P3E3_9RHOB|nr:FAD-binding oxidoreductase [Ketogulonicigenium robustum]ARO15911.1 D-amino acid dehydrogenase protein [Ketogulonicigenium robustum]